MSANEECKAVQMSDQIVCECGNRWDMNDFNPPPCRNVKPLNPPGKEVKANDRQVAGNHYSAEIQHWDFAASHNFDYFQGQITKYVTRWKKKNGIQDLLKAQHFLEKYIELEKAKHELQQEDTHRFDRFYGGHFDTSHPVSFDEAKERIAAKILSDAFGPQSHGYVNQDGQTAVKYEYKPFAPDNG